IAVGHVIRSVVGTRVPRPVLRRIYDVSSGNPFYARELARALVRRQDASLPPASLPLPQTLSDVVGERIAALSPAAREVLIALATWRWPRLVPTNRSRPHSNKLLAAHVRGAPSKQPPSWPSLRSISHHPATRRPSDGGAHSGATVTSLPATRNVPTSCWRRS